MIFSLEKKKEKIPYWIETICERLWNENTVDLWPEIITEEASIEISALRKEVQLYRKASTEGLLNQSEIRPMSDTMVLSIPNASALFERLERAERRLAEYEKGGGSDGL